MDEAREQLLVQGRGWQDKVDLADSSYLQHGMQPGLHYCDDLRVGLRHSSRAQLRHHLVTSLLRQRLQYNCLLLRLWGEGEQVTLNRSGADVLRHCLYWGGRGDPRRRQLG